MGIDATASLGYGIKITDKKLIKQYNESDEDFIDEKDGLTVLSHGGYDESGTICICISKSETMIFCWDNPKCITAKNLSTNADWDEKLKTWAKAHGVKKPKIGWWLCCSMG